jgi:pimeloyl-ACP methyl ester carboxylesterase
MITLILVHGACHGGWCWERVMPLLEAEGVRVVAPDLPEWQPGARDPIGFWGEFVADLARAQAPEDRVILCGHSRGGVVISAAAEAAPEAVSGLIYLAASLLPRGQTLTGTWRAYTDLAAEWVAPEPDEASFRIAPGCYQRMFCPDSDTATAAQAEARLRTEPFAAFATPMRITPERFGSVPRAYVETSRDMVIPLDFQRRMEAALPCDPVVTLDADHSPFLAMPERLAEVLIEICRR